MFRQLLGQIDRAVLTPGAAEGDHQILEPPTLIIGHAGVHEQHDAGEILMHALLLVEIIDHRRIFSSQTLESILASGIGQAAAIEHESTAISAFVLRQSAMKRETEDPD